MNDLAEDVLAIIRRRSAERPIDRKKLVWTLKTMGHFGDTSDSVADRKARQAIQELRTDHPEGGRIVSSSQGAGYWFARSAEEIEASLEEDESRIRALSKRLKNMRRAAERLRARPMEQERMF